MEAPQLDGATEDGLELSLKAHNPHHRPLTAGASEKIPVAENNPVGPESHYIWPREQRQEEQKEFISAEIDWEPRSSNPFGLGALAFGLLVGAVTCIVTAALVGGAVGGALLQRNKSILSNSSCSLATATIFTEPSPFLSTAIASTASATAAFSSSPATTTSLALTDYVPPEAQSVDSVFLDCPGINNETMTIEFQNDVDEYNIQCYVDYLFNDIALIIAYAVEDCILACSAVNKIDSGGNAACYGVHFNAEMSSSVQSFGGNCWLKSALENESTNTSLPNLSAVLVS